MDTNYCCLHVTCNVASEHKWMQEASAGLSQSQTWFIDGISWLR